MKKQKKKSSRKHRRAASELPGSHVKMSFRHHILPPLMGVIVMALVLGFFNSQYIIATLSDHFYKPPPDAGIQDTSLTNTLPPDPAAPAKIIISSIGVEAPVIYDQTTVNEASFQKALQRGVVHYPDTAAPGQVGNVVIFGHSSGQAWAPGAYKFVFTHLDRLQPNDKIFLEYQGTRYMYRIKGKNVVPPTEVSVLKQGTGHTLTLITCTPVGTNKNRLIITADQVLPLPTRSPEASQPIQATEIETLPSQSNPSLWESIREWFR